MKVHFVFGNSDGEFQLVLANIEAQIESVSPPMNHSDAMKALSNRLVSLGDVSYTVERLCPTILQLLTSKFGIYYDAVEFPVSCELD